MPSIIGHSAIALLLQQTFNKKKTFKILALSLFCGFVPDLDVISFSYGIPYESMFGHRGLSHSIVFSALIAFFVTFGFFPELLKARSKSFLKLFFLFFAITLSHPLLDAMTDGGLGVALLSPISNERFFFPFRPIPVSLLGFNNLTSERSLSAFYFELIFLALPSFLIILLLHLRRKKSKSK